MHMDPVMPAILAGILEKQCLCRCSACPDWRVQFCDCRHWGADGHHSTLWLSTGVINHCHDTFIDSPVDNADQAIVHGL